MTNANPEHERSFFDAMRGQIQATPMPPPRRRFSSRRLLLAASERRVRLGLLSSAGIVLAGMVIVAVLVLSATTTTPPAYALTYNANGTITVTLNDLATAVPRLNAKFAQLGINETVIPIKVDCHSIGGPRSQQADPYATIGPGSMSESFTYSKHERPPPAGFKYVLAAKQLPDGQIETWIGAIKPPLPTCFSDAPSQS